jgi:hypothetical protein
MEFSIRDPNWNIDAGAQAITSLITEKPDVIVVHNPDVNSYARLIQRAEQAGIYIISVNMRSSMGSSGFVGADYTRIGEMQAEQIVKVCGKGSGTSGKVAIVQGVVTSGASGFARKGIENVLSKHPEIKITCQLRIRQPQHTLQFCKQSGICGIMERGTWGTRYRCGVQEFVTGQAGQAGILEYIRGGAKFSCTTLGWT